MIFIWPHLHHHLHIYLHLCHLLFHHLLFIFMIFCSSSFYFILSFHTRILVKSSLHLVQSSLRCLFYNVFACLCHVNDWDDHRSFFGKLPKLAQGARGNHSFFHFGRSQTISFAFDFPFRKKTNSPKGKVRRKGKGEAWQQTSQSDIELVKSPCSFRAYCSQ